MLETKIQENEHRFLAGGGECGELIRNYPWSETSIGPPELWPNSLRTILRILLNTSFPMFLWWGEDLLCFYNDAYRVSLGTDGKHPAIGKKAVIVWADIWEFIGPLIKDVMQTGKPVWFEDQLVGFFRNGKKEDIYWTFSYSPAYGDSEKIEGVIVTCTETTEKVKAQKALWESEQNLRNTILQAPVAIALFKGPNHVVNLANDRMYELWGRNAEETMHRPVFEALPEATNQGFEAILNRVYETGEIFNAEDIPVKLPRETGVETIYMNVVYEPFHEADGTISGILAVAVDITAQHMARLEIEEIVLDRTRELAKSNFDLQRSNAELAQFAYIASHDLQEPVRKISAFTQLLDKSLEDRHDEQSKNYIGKIGNSTNRMNILIRDVLAYSELISNINSFEKVDLNEILQNLESDYEWSIEKTGATIQRNGLPVIDAIPLQMSQLFGNLMANSLKFIRPETQPVIRISARNLSEEEITGFKLDPLSRYYDISFSDNGIGFKPEYSDRIFDIFQRLHRKSEFEGTGIGLAICKKIAVNHQGKISATDSSENGAVFHIILPEKQQGN